MAPEAVSRRKTVETDLLALVEEDGFRVVQKSQSRGGQYNGPCPFEGCGGTDRFRIQPYQGRYGWFACNQCGRKGSAVDYLMLKRGMTKQEALTVVGWMPKDGSEPGMILPRSAYNERPQWNEPPERWQEGATALYRRCQRCLWSDQGREALAYLQRRGLTENTIKTAMLGYHAKEAYGSAQEWGRPVKLPQGIVIPWFFQGKVWRITIRDERVKEGEGRYMQVAGGSNGLYLADSLTLKRPATVMTEGEFDALSLAQECRDLVSVVATGTTQGSHTPRWVSLLACQQCVLVAFDAEETGDSAASWWTTHLERAQRLRPWWKDANQMLQDGADLRRWLGASVPLHASPRRYMPRTLPSLPRTQCPFVCMVVKQRQVLYTKQSALYQIGEPCKGKPLHHGWCVEHQLSQDMLDLGAATDYPALNLTEHRGIGDGVANWEAYVILAPAKWLDQDIQRVKALMPALFPETQEN